MSTLEQIAQKLKATRESKGITLEQVYEKTRIPLNHLTELDEGRFDDLPEPVYIAGFIKLYASQVGLNGQMLANEYRQWVDSEIVGVNGRKHRMKSAPDVPIIVSDEYFQKSKIDPGPPTFKTLYFNLICILLVLGLISYLGMTQFNNYNNQLEGNYAVPQQGVPGAKQSQTEQRAGTVAGTSPGSNQLVITANRHVWVEVKSAATGDNLFVGYLEQGSRKTFDTPDQGLRIRAVDGGSVNVNYQGKTAVLGEAGQEIEKVFAPVVTTNNTTAGLTSGTITGSTADGTTVGTTSSINTVSSTAATNPNNVLPVAKTPAVKQAGAVQVMSTTWRRRHPADGSYGYYNSEGSAAQLYKSSEGRLDTE